MNVAAISQTLGLIIQLATIITLIYALSKFLHKSSDDIKEWRKDMDDWRKGVDKRFEKGTESRSRQSWHSLTTLLTRTTQRS